jgi:hypothetical protein
MVKMTTPNAGTSTHEHETHDDEHIARNISAHPYNDA